MPDKPGIPIAAEMWVIKFDDADVPDEVFFGENAEKCAREVFKLRNYSWNCHLFGPAERISSLAHQLSQEKERLKGGPTQPCGHSIIWEIRSAETFEVLYCDICNMRSELRDALQMEAHYKSENARLTEALRVKEEECERLRDRERDVCAAVTRQCDVKKINEIMQDTLKARDDRALLAARRTQERGNDGR